MHIRKMKSSVFSYHLWGPSSGYLLGTVLISSPLYEVGIAIVAIFHGRELRLGK